MQQNENNDMSEAPEQKPPTPEQLAEWEKNYNEIVATQDVAALAKTQAELERAQQEDIEQSKLEDEIAEENRREEELERRRRENPSYDSSRDYEDAA